MNFPVGNKWYPIDKTRDAKVGTNPQNKFQIIFGKTVSLSGNGFRIEYPYAEEPRNSWVTFNPSVTMTDGILPGSPERTITADIRYRLKPTYD